MATKRDAQIEPTLSFATPAAWEAWLRKHHAKASGLWLRMYKKASGEPSVDYAQALDVALAWGWIDAQKKSFDDVSWIQRFCPRRAKSRWSKINRDKVAALAAAGKMQPAGQAQVDAAKADGRWDAAYDSPKNAKVPDDLAAALAAAPKAAKFFASLNAANRYAILYRVQSPKKPETRERRIRELVAMCERGEKLHP